MEIKTKYSIGEAVYILDGYQIRRANIAGIMFQQMGASSPCIQYKFAVFPIRKEDECFCTKEELIKHISK